jgi:hypothetical protein
VSLRTERIHQAGKAGLRNRLIDAWHVVPARADELLLAWEGEAARRGLSPGDFGYWREAAPWIRSQLER